MVSYLKQGWYPWELPQWPVLTSICGGCVTEHQWIFHGGSYFPVFPYQYIRETPTVLISNLLLCESASVWIGKVFT